MVKKNIKFIKIREIFPKHGFIQNVITLMTGATIAQAVPIAISPILTRLYTPEDFATLALFIAIVSSIAIIITGQYEAAIILPKKDEDAVNLIALSLIITIVTTIITFIVVLVFNKPITTLFKNELISKWLYFVPLTIFLTGISRTLNFWMTRKKAFKTLSISSVVQSSSNVSIKLGMGLYNAGPAGMIGASICGRFVSAGYLGWIFFKYFKKTLKLISKNKIMENLIQYQDFPKFNAPQGFLDILNQNGIIFIFTVFYSFSSLGFYSLSMNFIRKPFALVGLSVAQVFFQRASEVYNDQKAVWNITKKVIITLTILALPIFIIIFLFGPNLFSFIFGENWHEAGVYAQILSPWFFVQFITSPISSIPLIYSKQKQFLFIGIGLNISVPIIFLLFSFLSFDIKLSLFALSITASIYTFILIFWFRNLGIHSRNNAIQ